MINREDSALIARERQNRRPENSGQRTFAQQRQTTQSTPNKAPLRAGKTTAKEKSALIE